MKGEEMSRHLLTPERNAIKQNVKYYSALLALFSDSGRWNEMVAYLTSLMPRKTLESAWNHLQAPFGDIVRVCIFQENPSSLHIFQ